MFGRRRELDRGGDSLVRRVGGDVLGGSCCNWLLLFFSVGVRCRGRGLYGSCDRLRAALDLGVANGLDLRETLLFFVHANRDELDDLLRDAEATLDLGDQRTCCGNVQQDVETIVELADAVGEPAAAHLLDALHFAATIGDVRGEAS